MVWKGIVSDICMYLSDAIFCFEPIGYDKSQDTLYTDVCTYATFV